VWNVDNLAWGNLIALIDVDMINSSPDTFTSVDRCSSFQLSSFISQETWEIHHPTPLHPSDRCSSIQLSSCSSSDAVFLRLSPARKTRGKLGRADHRRTELSSAPQAKLKVPSLPQVPSFKGSRELFNSFATHRRLKYTFKAIWASDRPLQLACFQCAKFDQDQS
jgi:hypothetical protein